jgi:hypothetical protein
VLLVAGGLYASNMGFKLNKVLSFTGTANGTNTIALPFNRQIGIDNAEQLLNDIKTTGSPINAASNVQKLDTSTNGLIVYSAGPADGTPFALDKAVGYYVKMTTNATYIVVGSDDPAYVHTFLGSGSSANGTNFYALPYHTTTTNAEQLLTELKNTGSPINNISNVQNFDKATNGLVVYSAGPADGTPFALAAGDAYLVKVSGATNVSYSPSHY